MVDSHSVEVRITRCVVICNVVGRSTSGQQPVAPPDELLEVELDDAVLDELLDEELLDELGEELLDDELDEELDDEQSSANSVTRSFNSDTWQRPRTMASTAPAVRGRK